MPSYRTNVGIKFDGSFPRLCCICTSFSGECQKDSTIVATRITLGNEERTLPSQGGLIFLINKGSQTKTGTECFVWQLRSCLPLRISHQSVSKIGSCLVHVVLATYNVCVHCNYCNQRFFLAKYFRP